jgi:hypothetical protein
MGLFSNPAKSAMPYLNQIPGMVGQYFNPYIQAGLVSMPQFQQQAYSAATDPGALLNQIAGGYQKSPGFDFAKNQAMDAMTRSAAAGGMAGSMQNQQQNAQLATQLANQDFNNYMKNALGVYGTGFGGLEDIMKGGQTASQNAAGLLGSNLMNQGNLAYSGQANQNQMWGNLLGGGMGMLGNLLSGFFGGG